jgi:hypothetical protein
VVCSPRWRLLRLEETRSVDFFFSDPVGKIEVATAWIFRPVMDFCCCEEKNNGKQWLAAAA